MLRMHVSPSRQWSGRASGRPLRSGRLRRQTHKRGGWRWAGDGDASTDWESTPELDYLHDILLATMRERRDPRAG
jgi:hypothetical protein